MRSLGETQSEQAQLKEQLKMLQIRVLELEKTVKRKEAELVALKASVKRLKKSRKRKSSKSIERKLAKKIAKIEKSIKDATTPQPADDKNAEKEAYTAAYLAHKGGRYDEAIRLFRKVIADYSSGAYTDQAYFWLGKSYYAQRRLRKAIGNFHHLVTKYPKSTKHAEALLMLGIIYQEAQRPGDAKASLKRLVREHPGTEAAKQAQVRLDAMEGAKRN